MDLLHGSRCILIQDFPVSFFWIFLYLSFRIFLSLCVYLPWISHTDLTVSSMYLSSRISLLSRIQDFPLSQCIFHGSPCISHPRSCCISPGFPCISHSEFPCISNGSPCISHPAFSCLSLCIIHGSPCISHPRSRCIYPGFLCISHSEFPCISNGSPCISHPGFSSISHVSRLDHRAFPMDISFWISMYFPGSLCNSLKSLCIFLFLPYICICIFHPESSWISPCISPGSGIRDTNKPPISVCL
jgi:hypothetical protein